MKKKKFLKTATAMLLFNGALFNVNAQVTIGADQAPKTTLDVVKLPAGSTTADGIMAPRMTLAEINAESAKYGTAQTGAMVYITDASGSTKPGYSDQVTCVGLIFWSGSNWMSSCAAPKTYAAITAQPKAFTFYETGFETPEDLVFGAGGSSTMTYKWYKISGNNINARVAVPCVGTDVVGGAANLNKNTFTPNVIKGSTEVAGNTGFYRYYCVAKNATGDSVVSHIAEVAVGCGAKNLQGEWITFMCHNLGATNKTIALQKNTPIQFGAANETTGDHRMVANEDATYGDLFQWGRIADEHEKRNKITVGSWGDLATDNAVNWNASSPPTFENGNILGTSQRYPQQQVSRTDPNGYYGKFIKTIVNNSYNWYAGGNEDINSVDYLWRENAFPANDPCQHINADGTTYSTFYPPASSSLTGGYSGTGWRMPSQSEWASLFRGGSTAGTFDNALANTMSWYQLSTSATEGAKGLEVKPDGVTTTLFLPASGYRGVSNAKLFAQSTNGFYWSGSISSNNAYNLFFSIYSSVNPAYVSTRGSGFAVRCIKN